MVFASCFPSSSLWLNLNHRVVLRLLSSVFRAVSLELLSPLLRFKSCEAAKSLSCCAVFCSGLFEVLVPVSFRV